MVTLNELIPNAVAAAQAEAATRGITITAEGEPVRTTGDPRLLERVIGNLVENAVRYNVPGGWVRIETESDGQRRRTGSPGSWSINSGVPVPAGRGRGPVRRLPPRRPGPDRSARRRAGAVHRAGDRGCPPRLDRGRRAQPAGGLRVEISLPATADLARLADSAERLGLDSMTRRAPPAAAVDRLIPASACWCCWRWRWC